MTCFFSFSHGLSNVPFLMPFTLQAKIRDNKKYAILTLLLVISILSLSFFAAVPNSFAGSDESGWGTVNVPVPGVLSGQVAAQYSTAVSALATYTTSGDDYSDSEAAVSSRINSLALSSGYNPLSLYTYVANEIGYVPYYGSKKDATTTLITGQGNDWDQASLLIALLRASDIAASYVRGTAVYPVSYLASILGVDVDKTEICQILSNGGYKNVGAYENDFIQVDRVWVSATVEGVALVLDPAFSPVQNTAGIDLNQAMGADSTAAEIYNASAGGAQITQDYAENVNEDAVRELLDTYTMNLVSWIAENNSGADMGTIIGSRSIVKSEKGLEDCTSLPGIDSVSNVMVFDEIPDTERFKLTVQYNGIDITLPGYQICGKSLKIVHEGDDHTAVLMLDDQVIATGDSTEQGKCYFIYLTAVHPYASDDFDQTSSTYLESPCPYVLAMDIGGSVSSAMLGERLADFNSQEDIDETDAVYRKLDLVGMNYLNLVARTGQILNRISGCATVRHHKIGIIGQEKAPLLDMRLGRKSIFSLSGSDTDARARHFAGSGLTSALEHLTLEQTGIPAVSTVRAMVLNNRAGNKTYFATDSNYWDETDGLELILRKELQYCLKWTRGWGQMVNSGKTIIIPEDRLISQNDWEGFAFLAYDIGTGLVNSNISYQIGGGIPRTLEGGHGTLEQQLGPLATEYVSQQDPVETVADPVDIISGHYMHSHQDLALGNGMPVPLAFTRSYVSSRADRNENKGLGHGWRHSLDTFINPLNNNPGTATGAGTPTNAAALIVGAKVMHDMALQYPADPMGLLLNALVQQWVTDQMTQNSVAIHLGNQTLEYTRLPDGSYTPPPGMNAVLSLEDDGTFLLTELSGTRYVFNAGNRLDYIEDAHGNRLDFEYNGTLLYSVTDSFNRTIFLDFTGGQLTGVRDSSGRSVDFEYDGNNDLVKVRDTESKETEYTYDDDHKLLTKSSLQEIYDVVNRYDEYGRVKEQDVSRQTGTGTYRFFYGGGRHRMTKPSGEEMIYNLDHKNRIVSIRDGLLNRTQFEYDSRNNLVKLTDPESNETGFIYDAHDRLVSVTNALDQTTYFDWNSDNDLETVTNPMDQTVYYQYLRHQPRLVRTFPTDSLQIESRIEYNDAGLPEYITDGAGRTTYFNYNQGFPEDSWITDPSKPITRSWYPTGDLYSLTDPAGAETRFLRNSKGQVLEKRDPLGQITTYRYTDDGRLEEITDRNADLTSFRYTPNGKLESISYPDSTSVAFSYHTLYDGQAADVGVAVRTPYSHKMIVTPNLMQVRTAIETNS